MNSGFPTEAMSLEELARMGITFRVSSSGAICEGDLDKIPKSEQGQQGNTPQMSIRELNNQMGAGLRIG